MVSFSSPIMSAKVIKGEGAVHPLSKIPLLPPPPPSNKPKVGHRAPARPPAPSSSLLPPENKLKSKSLPRGLPSDGTVFDSEKKIDTIDASEVEMVSECLEMKSLTRLSSGKIYFCSTFFSQHFYQ